MNIYFDTEFTGLKKDTDLISIGMIDEVGRTFYAEFSDFDINKCDDWIKHNVLSHMYNYNKTPEVDAAWNLGVASTQIFGTREEIKEELIKWLSIYKSVQFVSDVCHYDFVLLIDIFGTVWDLPESINPSCHDINQDIAKYYNISEKKAFDVCREDIVSHMIPSNPLKHNALWDARVISKIYHFMNESNQEASEDLLSRTEYRDAELLD